MTFLKFISERLKQFFSGDGLSKAEETKSSDLEGREKVIAFSVALFFALCLWFIVNLNRDFTVTIDVPIQLSNLPEDQIVSNEIPASARVNLSGEGWKLISVYSNPPRVIVNAEVQQVNLSEQVRNQVSAFTDLNVVQVEPSQLNIETERKVSKMVPVLNRVDISLRNQYGLMRPPVLVPDSVLVTGAESKLAELESWETENVQIADVNRSMEREVPLQSGSSAMSVEPGSVIMHLDVAEFTEAEIRVPVRTRNLPSGQAVTYNPSSITVRFDVPIEQYSEIQGTRPFSAYVDYSVIEGDDSGLVTPEVDISETTDHIVRLRSFQPPRVSYFRVVSQ